MTELDENSPSYRLRRDIMASVGAWRKAGSADKEWRNLLANPETAEMLRSLSEDLEEFVIYFRAMATFLGLPNDTQPFIFIFESGQNDLRMTAAGDHLATAMGARLLLHFRDPLKHVSPQQQSDMRYGVPAPLVQRTRLHLHG